MIRRPPRSTQSRSSAASDVYKRQSKNINNETQLGNFREDLFHRLNVFQISIEPLSNRVSDIPLLIEYFSNTISKAYNLKDLNIDNEDSYLINHFWPGNVRELRNLIERIAILSNNCLLYTSPSPRD